MAKKQKYVAYVGSYSYTGSAKGITIYDVDAEAGKFKKRSEIEVENSSDLITSFDKKTLYTIADEGVVAYKAEFCEDQGYPCPPSVHRSEKPLPVCFRLS